MSSPSRRYVITGCAGFIGSHLADTLISMGHQVVGVDSFSSYYSRARKLRNLATLAGSPRFELIEHDMVHLDLELVLDGVDGVFHLAAQPGVRGSWGGDFSIYLSDNILASQRLFEAAANLSVRVVYASSSSVYGDAAKYPSSETDPLRPVSPYGVTKLTCERLADAYRQSAGLDAVGVRYFTVYGPRQRPDMALYRIIRALRRNDSFQLYGTGQQSRDVTFVGDATDATYRLMVSPTTGACYNVGGGCETTVRHIIEECELLMDGKLDIRLASTAKGDVARTAADTSAIRGETGWLPVIDLHSGLQRQVEWQLSECAE